MAKDGKFGTFGGVFTPSILTILGVIMYLRLPWVVGNAGLVTGLGIIAVAHVISVSTGLSISSIATDKAVGAGGPYYIVSRSLGLPIGGTLGVALFLGLSFSISLYVIGFSESLLDVFEIEATPNAIRIAGSTALIVLTIVTLISTAFAIKTQYLILGLIGLSLLSIFFGSVDSPPSTPPLAGAAEGPSPAVMFGIFFPAVTGFTAGVNMSGDLLDPKKSIPRGTLLAIGAGFLVYVGLALFLLYRVPQQMLIEDLNVLQTIALVPGLVIAGVWGATLSSALGSILGAPRILQALASDGIMPRFLSRGYGPTREPRNALILAFILGEVGILIAELDVIARVVSMVFLTTYGFLNLCCAIESWASPDFRPAFRIPKSVSVVGAATSVLVMVQLDLAAMAGAVVLMAGLFLVLQRRQLKLESGDTWEGVWSSLIRSGLYRLSRTSQQQRNWKPNVLMFRRPGVQDDFIQVGRALVTGSGMLTDFVVGTPAKPGTSADADQLDHVGVFHESLPTRQPWQAIPEVSRYHGFGGVRPNTVLLHFDEYEEYPEHLAEVLTALADQDRNQLVYSSSTLEATKRGDRRRIDVWWRPGAGHLALSVALVRFITDSTDWHHASLRFILLSDDSSNNDILRTTTRRVLRESRVEAAVRVISNTVDGRSFEDWIREESKDSDLVVVGLPEEAEELSATFVSDLIRLCKGLGAVLFVRASSSFEEVLRVARKAPSSLLPPPSEGESLRRELQLPNAPALASAVSDFSATSHRLVSTFYEHCIARFSSAQIELLRKLRAAASRELDHLDKALSHAAPGRFRKAVSRSRSSFLFEVREALREFEDQGLTEQQATVEGRVSAFLHDEALDPSHWPKELRVERDAKDFDVSESDSPRVRRFKRRRRLLRFGKGPISYRVPEAKLRAYYAHLLGTDVLEPALTNLLVDSHQLIIHVGKLLGSSKLVFSLLAGPAQSVGAVKRSDSQDSEHSNAVGEPGDDASIHPLRAFFLQERDAQLAHFDALIDRQKAALDRLNRRMASATHDLLQHYADDLARFDLPHFIKRERKQPKDSESMLQRIEAQPERWFSTQRKLMDRALVAVDLSTFQHRVAALLYRERDIVVSRLESGVSRELAALRDALGLLRKALEASESSGAPQAPTTLPVNVNEPQRFEPSEVLEALNAGAESCIRDLPDSIQTLSDESIDSIEQGDKADLEVVDLSLKQLVEFLVEAELVTNLRMELERVPAVEARASAVGQDAHRLVSFQLTEVGEESASVEGEADQVLLPVVQNAEERVAQELAKLREVSEHVSQAMDTQLEALLEATNAYEITRSSSTIDQHMRRSRGRKAVSGLSGVLRRGLGSVRESMVSGLYRASAGVVLARWLQTRADHSQSTVQQVLSYTTAHAPSQSVIDQLPFYYRQLFLGQSTPSDNFWVGRERELAAAQRALGHHRAGLSGALMIVGERGAGKTALTQRICAKLLDGRQVFRVRPQIASSCEVADFRRALGHATNIVGTVDEVFRALPEHSVVLIEDLELWWQRSAGGLKVVEYLRQLVSQHGSRVLFIVSMGSHAFRLVNRLTALSDAALALIDCGPLPAERLKDIITLRHSSTGLTYELNGKTEPNMTAWNVARLFSAHFAYCGGQVGPALQSWVTHVSRVTKDLVFIRQPQQQPAEVLDGLRTEQTVLLIQLILHRRASVRCLATVTGLATENLQALLDSLLRMKLIEQPRPRLYEVNRYIAQPLSARLVERGLL